MKKTMLLLMPILALILVTGCAKVPQQPAVNYSKVINNMNSTVAKQKEQIDKQSTRLENFSDTIKELKDRKEKIRGKYNDSLETISELKNELEEYKADAKAKKAAAKAKAEWEAQTAYFESDFDVLEIGEKLGDVKDAVTSEDLDYLKSSSVTTDEGSTDYNQYLSFSDEASNSYSAFTKFAENDNDVVSNYLFMPDDGVIYEYEVEFEEGLESQVESFSLSDLDGKAINLLGQPYTIVDAEYDGSVELLLMSGDISDTLREGQTVNYTVDGTDYEVTLVFVSDPSSGGSVEAKFSVNGELTDSLKEGSTDTLSNGQEIGVRDILVNSRQGVAEFYLGAEKMTVQDSFNDGYNGRVEKNNEDLNDVEVSLAGSEANDVVRINNMKFRMRSDDDIYLTNGTYLSEYLDEPMSLLSSKFDMGYEGLSKPKIFPVKFDSQGDDSYKLTFTNNRGVEFNIDLFELDEGTVYRGTEDDALVFVEGANESDYLIKEDDSFIVSDKNSDKGVSNVVVFEDLDEEEKQVQFNVGDNSIVSTYENGTGELILNGKSYTFHVGDGLAVDLNGDGDISGDEVKVIVRGGGILDLGDSNSASNVNNLSLRTLGENFDENLGDEVVEFEIVKNDDKLDADVVSGVELFDLENDDEEGLTRYGVRVELDDDDASNLEFEYPENQRVSNVFVKIGE